MTVAPPNNPIFCAIDTTDLDWACGLAERIGPVAGGIKLGLEFYTAFGPEAVRNVAGRAARLFLDLKFHDIPNTVAGAVRAAARMTPYMLTVHAAGGPAMLRAAVDAAGEAAEADGIERPLIIGVTVLTSLDDADLERIGMKPPVSDAAAWLADLACETGLDGLVCSPHEIAALRQRVGPEVKLVVPGIRPKGADAGDQKRVLTPREAIDAGADFLVIGRPITQADDPVAALSGIVSELA